MKTHPTLGDSSVPKMFEVGWKRTGDIGQKVTPAAQYTAQYAAQNAANTKDFNSKVFYTPQWVRELYGIHDPRSEAVDREFGIDPVSGELLTSTKDNSSSDAIKLVESGGNATADPAREPVPSLITPPPADQPSDIATADAARAGVSPEKTGNLGLTKADYDAIRAGLSPEEVAKMRATMAAYRAADREPW
jgi:hypothetical protein